MLSSFAKVIQYSNYWYLPHSCHLYAIHFFNLCTVLSPFMVHSFSHELSILHSNRLGTVFTLLYLTASVFHHYGLFCSDYASEFRPAIVTMLATLAKPSLLIMTCLLMPFFMTYFILSLDLFSFFQIANSDWHCVLTLRV